MDDKSMTDMLVRLKKLVAELDYISRLLEQELLECLKKK